MGDRARVLIVDDDESLCRSMALVLKRREYEVTIANSGPEVIEKVQAQPFDIIFMDIKMPSMNGVETLEQIRMIRPDAKVMMMTAYTVEDLVEKALTEGAIGITYKPLNIEKIIRTIDEVTHTKRGMQIMVVDDDPGTAVTLRNILMRQGHRVNTAPTGEDAITMEKKKAHDIIIIDMKLPSINGLETYLAMKKINPDVIAVMTTAYRQEMASLIDIALKNSAYSVLYKPIDLDAFLTIVDEIWDKKRMPS